MEKIDAILEAIRPNRSALFGFFSMMPKGGDLHHHYSGSIYAENYIDYVFQKNFYINNETMEVVRDISVIPDGEKGNWKDFSQFKSESDKSKIKLKLLRLWSTRDFVKGSRSSDEHFFATFPSFNVASRENYIEGLRELKSRAINQRVSYLETIFISVNTKDINLPDEADLDKKFLQFQRNRDEAGLEAELEAIFSTNSTTLKEIAAAHTRTVEQLHVDSQVESLGSRPTDSEIFVLRFQNYVGRYKQPVDVFIDLCACFYSCDESTLISGVNIVGAENSEIAMRDYWLHMMFFRFLESKFPRVHYAIHAGELVAGMVPPEKLGTHVKLSLQLKNLRRIGHAVDIIYDRDFNDTIEKLQSRQIAIEINLTSNEFILGVAEDLHPVEIYFRNGIPIVVSTDDEGVLRTSITEQYVLLAHRYKLSYSEIRRVVRNSILYSNLENSQVKELLLARLDKDFSVFERDIMERFKPIVDTPQTFDSDDWAAAGKIDEDFSTFYGDNEQGFRPLVTTPQTADSDDGALDRDWAAIGGSELAAPQNENLPLSLASQPRITFKFRSISSLYRR